MYVPETPAELAGYLTYLSVALSGVHPNGAKAIKQASETIMSQLAQHATDTRIANEVESLLNDLDIGSVADLRKHITDLTAKVETMQNPPYRIEISSGTIYFSDVTYIGYVMRGDVQQYKTNVCDTEEEARAEAQAFIDSLTAPFQSKDS